MHTNNTQIFRLVILLAFTLCACEANSAIEPTVYLIGEWDTTLSRTNCPGVSTKATITFFNYFGDNSLLGYVTTTSHDINPTNCTIVSVNYEDPSVAGHPSTVTAEEFIILGGGDDNDNVIIFTNYEIIIDIYSSNGSYGRLDMKRSFVDIDGDGINDNVDNCPSVSNHNQVDTDSDGKGDACDTDDDNDGMPDSYEKSEGFNPLDKSDASADADGDGYSNLVEYQEGTDPHNPGSNPGPKFMPWLPLLLDE